MNILEFLSEWGADLGVTIGLLCPYIGAYRRTMNINGPKERAFAVKCFAWSLVGTVLFLGLFVGLKFAPQPYNGWRFLLLLLIIPYLLIDIPLNRRQAQIRAEESHTGDQSMTSAETPAASSPKCSPCGWKERMGPIMGIVFWMIIGAFVFNAFLPKNTPQQGLRITNTGSQSVDIRKLARWSWQEEEWTLHPGETFLGKFAPGEHFRFARSDQAPPKPGTTPPAYLVPRFKELDGREFLPSRSYLWGAPPLHRNADGSGTILLRHVDRTAEVRVTESGEIEFEFTDL